MNIGSIGSIDNHRSVNMSLAVATGGSSSLSLAYNDVPTMYRYIGKSAVGGTLGYIGSSLLYPNASFQWGKTQLSRSTFVAGAMFLGFLANEFAHDKIFPYVSRDAKLTHFTSLGSSVATVAAVDWVSHILVDPEVAQSLEVKKVVLESAGAVILTEYLYEHVLMPFFGYNLNK